MSGHFQDLERENQELRQQLAVSRQEVAELRQQLSELRQENEHLERAFAEQQVTVSQLQMRALTAVTAGRW